MVHARRCEPVPADEQTGKIVEVVSKAARHLWSARQTVQVRASPTRQACEPPSVCPRW